MDSFDGAEICELVDAYILNVLDKKHGKERVRFYRDNCLACFESVSGPQAKIIREDVVKIFKQD